MEIFILLMIFLTQNTATAKIKEIEKKLTTIKKEEKALKQKEKSILEELNEIDKKIIKSKKKIEQLKKQEEDLISSLNELLILGEKVNESSIQKEISLSDKIFLLYKYKIFKQKPTILEYVKDIIEEDINEHNKLKKLSDSIQTEEQTTKKILEKLKILKKEEEIEYKNIATRREEKSEILKNIKKERSEKEKLIRELEKARKELEKLFAKVETHIPEKKREEISFIWPLKGKIVGEFGTVIDKTLGTKLINKGIDIEAPDGTNILAADDGVIIYEGPFLGYGKIVIIDHKNGFCSLYGYLSETFVIKGEEVKQKEVIGKIGSSGFIDKPTLHFEIRKNGEAVNPINFLP